MRALRVTFASATLLALTSCSTNDASHDPATTPAPRAEVASFSRGHAPAVRPSRAKLTSDGVTITAEFPGETNPRSLARKARVALPATADGPAKIEDEATGLAVEVRLAEARKAPAILDAGLVRFDSPSSAAMQLYRPEADGTEDFLVLDAPPLHPITYAIHLGDHVAGLRLVARTLELLDARGVPRLRMDPPYVIGADGAIVPLSVDVLGCAFDVDGRVPYGRPVVDPGARDCSVVLSVPSTVRFPALVDPSWKTTGSMASARALTGAVTMPDGRVLVVGGATEDSQMAIAGAEIFDPATNTFTAIPDVPGARYDVTLTLLDDGRVLLLGGSLASGASIGTTSFWDGAMGAWTTGAPPPHALDGAFVIKFDDGRVFQGGGCVVPPNTEGCAGGDAVKTDTQIYDPKADSWTSGPSLTSPRYTATINRLADGSFLVATADTNIDLGATEDSAETVDAKLTAFTATSPIQGERSRVTSLSLPDGRVFFVGGFTFVDDGTGNLVEVAQASTQIYEPMSRAFVPGPKLPTGVYSNALYAFSTGTIAVPTGAYFDPSQPGFAFPIPASVLLDSGLTTWKSGPPPATPRYLAVTSQLANGTILAAGGLDESGSAVKSAELFGEPCTGDGDCTDGYCGAMGICQATLGIGSACTANDQCGSGECVDGVCCNVACSGQCQACDTKDAIGMCTSIDGAPHGTRAACGGTGTCGGTCVSSNPNSCTYPSATTTCGSSCENNAFVLGTCSGDGSCVTSTTPCGGYVCQPAGCPSSCGSSSDCSSGFACDETSHCVPNMASCKDEHTVQLPNGTTTDCSPYTCAAPGVCLTTCDSTEQCTSGMTCTSARACEPKVIPALPDTSGAGCGCEVPSSRGNDVGAIALVGLVVTLVRRRRRAVSI